MAVVTPDDVKNYFRYAANIDDGDLEDFITQEEYYVSLKLDITELPVDNPVIFSIVRDLVIYRVVSTKLQRLTAEDYAIGETHRREAMRRLGEAERNGITPKENNVSSDTVWTPDGPAEFTPEDFWLGRA